MCFFFFGGCWWWLIISHVQRLSLRTPTRTAQATSRKIGGAGGIRDSLMVVPHIAHHREPKFLMQSTNNTREPRYGAHRMFLVASSAALVVYMRPPNVDRRGRRIITTRRSATSSIRLLSASELTFVSRLSSQQHSGHGGDARCRRSGVTSHQHR